MKPIVIAIVILIIVIIIASVFLAYTFITRWYCPECTETIVKPCPDCLPCNPCDPKDENCDPCPKQQTCIDNCDQCPREVCPLTWIPVSFDNKLMMVADGLYLGIEEYNLSGIRVSPGNKHLWRYQNKKLYDITAGKYVRWIGFPINSSYNFFFQYTTEPSPPGSIEDEYEWDGYNFYLAHYYDDSHAYMLSCAVNRGQSDFYSSLVITKVPRAMVGKTTIPAFQIVDD